jgi:hypothetical protein
MTGAGDDQRWIAEAVDLLRAEGREALFRIRDTDTSMVPTLDPGRLVMIDFRPPRLRRGDLLLFRQSDYLVVHRLVGTARLPSGRSGLRTRGDAMHRLDPALSESDVVGRAVAAETRLGWRSLVGGRARLFARAMAWHDLWWARAGAGIARGGALAARAVPLVCAIDRALLRLAHAALFRLTHRRMSRPPSDRSFAAVPAEAGRGPAAGPR